MNKAVKINEIISDLERFAPPALAEEWDNVELMLGDGNAPCKGVMLALDLTADVAQQAINEGCNLIVTHHPFIFHAINSLDYSQAKAKLIAKLIKEDIAVYSMHTNLDKCEGGINSTLAKMFGKSDIQLDGVGAIASVEPTSLAEFAKRVSDVLSDRSVKIVGDPNKTIEKVYIVSGSGGSEYERARECADALLTGDLKHHNYIDAIEDGLAIVEYSHYSSEIIMQDVLAEVLNGVGVKVIKAKQSSPFRLLEEI